MGDSLLRVALRWLAHPVSLVAIGVMVLNDHVLKQAYGTWWTGKLSDVAGLVFFPALIAVTLAAVRPTRDNRGPTREASQRLVFAAVAVTGVGFAWVKATAVGAATASAVLTAITGPLFDGQFFGGSSIVRADVTDLLTLPALGLAAWVGIGAAQREGTARGKRGVRRTGRARRALTVAAVPIALLASVATGAAVNSDARIVADDGGAWRGQVRNPSNYGGDGYYTRTGSGWEPFYEDGAFAPSADAEPPAGLPDREQTEDCVPSDPAVCFRSMVGTTGVEASADGGDTWGVDWELSPDQVATLERVYDVRARDFVTQGVGVVEVAGGYVVVAGNGTDGFSVRGVDGDWARVGFAGMGCCDWQETADFDTVDQLPAAHAYPLGVLMGLVLSTLALPFLAAALRWGRRSRFHLGASIAAGLVYLFGARFGVLVLLKNSSFAPLTRSEPDLEMLLYIPLGVLAAVAVVVALAAGGLLRRGAVLATLGGWFAGALVAGLAAGATEVAGVDNVWVQVGVGVLALAALYAVYVPAARRRWVRFPGQGDRPLGGPPSGAPFGSSAPVPHVGRFAVPPLAMPPRGASPYGASPPPSLPPPGPPPPSLPPPGPPPYSDGSQSGSVIDS